MSIQAAATKLLFKLPKPILNKIIRSIPQNNKSNTKKEKPWHLKGNWAPVKDEIVVNDLEVKGEIPKEINNQQIVGVSFLAGIGFTMAIFIASLAFENSPMYIDSAKIGILIGSFISAVIGYLVLRFNKNSKINIADS